MSDHDELTPWTLPDLQLPSARTQNDPQLGAAEEWAEQIGGEEYRALRLLEMACGDSGLTMPTLERARLDTLNANKAEYVARRARELAAEWACPLDSRRTKS